MKNNFKYSLDNKRYHTLNYFYKTKFNTKVIKITLDGNFSCPNLDGTLSYKGCIYCQGKSIDTRSIKKQFKEEKEKMNKKWQGKYIAYFAYHSNTYASLKKLKKLYKKALKQNDVIGLSIATRCDCITDETLDYLEKLNKKTYLTVELGLQTIHNKTAKLINRCHTLEDFEKTYLKLKEKNINVVVHIINGLPYETKEMMIETVKYLNKLDITGIKIHMLYIEKNTLLEDLYKKEKFHILTKEEYIDITTTQLRYLNKKIVINRITGDPEKEMLIEPKWLLKKFILLNDIDKHMKKEDIYQGDLI